MADGGDWQVLDGNDGRAHRRADIRPSTVKLPECRPQNVQTVFDFFLQRFPRVSQSTWRERFAAGKVWTTGEVIDARTPYRPLLEVYYRREVEREPPVREDFRIVWCDHGLMVVDKPPNLPVTPGGRWVRHCLLHLLMEDTGNDTIAPLHRLDRLTSGVMVLSLDPETRSHFAGLFQPESLVEKTYTAVCEVQMEPPSERFSLAHHIVRSTNEYWRQVVLPGLPANARCEVKILDMDDGLALVRVWPSTGRKHQIRVQLAHEGLPILGDPLYGSVRSNDPNSLSQRLWLDAYRLAINDFPASPGGEALTAEWTSSRVPSVFFSRAAVWRASFD